MLTLSPRTVNETRGAVHLQRSRARRPTDLVGPAVSISGVAIFGTLSGSPHGRLNKMFQIVDNLSHQRGAHALRAGMDFIYNDDTITYPRASRGTYTFSSLANFLAGIYNNSGFTQTFGNPSSRRPIRTSASTRRTSGRRRPRLTLNAGAALRPAVARDDRDRPQQRVAARRASRGRRSRSRARSCAAAPVCSSIACRCARSPTRCSRRGNTTDLTQLQQISVSLSPTQAGAPVFPNILAGGGAAGDARQLHDDGSRTAERLLAAGQHRGRAADR